jgi:hypothetical protein
MCSAYGFSIHEAKEVYDRFAVANPLGPGGAEVEIVAQSCSQ